LYRRLFREAMQQAGLAEQIDPQVWKQEWIVNSQAVGNGKSTIAYLARYVFRVAISDDRILSIANGRVRFRYRKVGARRWRTMQLDAFEFMRRFLEHVLPRGLMKIRHYGFLSARANVPIHTIRERICSLYELIGKVIPVRKRAAKFKPLCCRTCGSLMRWVMFMPPATTARGG
jgi:hypothetical protein